MNAHQRRVAFRRLKREWPVGTLVTHGHAAGHWVITSHVRDWLSVYVAVPKGIERFPFTYSLRPHQLKRVPPTHFVP